MSISRLACIVPAFLLLFLPMAEPAYGQTRVSVTNTLDVGDGSLRQAIVTANLTPGVDTIVFNIPGAGPHSIKPTTALPRITDPVVIDGYTQPGASPNTSGHAFGSNAVLMIELDGTVVSGVSGAPGLDLRAGGSTIRGLVINRFQTGNGISVWGSGGNRIEGNFIGTDVTGLQALGNDRPVVIDDSPDNVVGGPEPAARNVLSGNERGIFISGPNAVGTVVQGNLIGLGRDGSTPLGNSELGVGVSFGASRTLIGGTSPEMGNLIAHNGHGGVGILTPETVENAILSNLIYSHLSWGIYLAQGPYPNDEGDLDDGANRLQNFPVPEFALPTGGTTVGGWFNSLPDGSYTLQFFSDESCGEGGFGQGRTLLGSTSLTTDGSGNAPFLFSSPEAVSLDQVVTATATDSLGNTSGFSTCATVSDFHLAVSPDQSTTPSTGSLPLTVSVEPDGEVFDHEVTLSCGAVAEGVTCEFSPETLIPGQAQAVSSLTVSTDETTPLGSGSVEVLGTFETFVRSDTVGVTVSGFSVDVAEPEEPVTRGESETYAVTVSAQGGAFSEPVNLACENVPEDVTCVFSPSSVTPGETSAVSTLTVGTGPATPLAGTGLSVVGTFGSLRSSVSLTLLLADFSLSVTPSSAVVTRGESVSFGVNVGTVGTSFDKPVSLTCSGLPAGSSCSFSPAVVTPGQAGGTATMTVQTATTGAGAPTAVSPYAGDLGFPWEALFGCLLLAMVAWRWRGARRWAGVTFFLVLYMWACGDDATGPKEETVTFTVAGTNGLSERSTEVTLTIR